MRKGSDMCFYVRPEAKLRNSGFNGGGSGTIRAEGEDEDHREPGFVETKVVRKRYRRI
jgi:hypothetical protein